MCADKANSSQGLLTGIKVLDLSRILAGPWATQLLADYGADVCKVEKPQVGDDTRHWGPPYFDCSQDAIDKDSLVKGGLYKGSLDKGSLDKGSLAQEKPDLKKLSAYFMAANRGKKSVAIDFTQAKGQALIKDLAMQSDVLVENYKVGSLKKYGLDYKSLAEINPKLIYCSITGFGQTGPMAPVAGYDAMIQAAGGLMSITGESDAKGGQPQKVGVAVTDLMTGMYATTAILAAINHRHQHGMGQHIDVALFDCQIAMLANQSMNYLVSSQVPERLGNSHPNIVPYQTFATNDGYLMIAVGNDNQFQRLCQLMNIEGIANSSEFRTNADRVENREPLLAILTPLFMQRSRNSWITELTQANVPASAVNTIDEVFGLAQTQARQMQLQLTDQLGNVMPQVANPVKFSQTPVQYNQAPPQLAEHTCEYLQSRLNLSDQELQQLIKLGVIA
jgi:crotonobetainyl-CoA:carnitine CoA-transferase CaiB-like acyl-CoA transferase